MLARNYCLIQLRAAKKLPTEPLEADLAEVFFEPEEDELEGDLNALVQCKQKLPETQRVSIHLFFTEEKCYKEIVAITGYTLNEVKSFIQNGKRNLKICLEKARKQ